MICFASRRMLGARGLVWTLVTALVLALVSRVAGAQSSGRSCEAALPSLLTLLSAHQRQVQAKARQRQLHRVARRARRSAWLPTLTVWTELRRVQDHDATRAAFDPMALKASHGQAQVYRGQLRWQLDQLVHHYAVTQALRLAREIFEAYQRDRHALAGDYGQLQALWMEACRQGWTRKAWEQALVLRAKIIARCGIQLPMPTRDAAPQANGP